METSPSASAAELALWRSLMVSALRRGVPRPEAEDLASQAFLKALQSYDAARGDFAPFCRAIHANLLRNWWRDRKSTDPWDEQTHDLPGPDDPHAAFADQEERVMFGEIANRILEVLEPDEAALFLAVGEVAREVEEAAISSAGRRIGLEPLKAWDVFRRIQRKARPFLGEFHTIEFCRPLPLMVRQAPLIVREAEDERPKPARREEAPPAILRRPVLRDMFQPPLLQIAACADAGFSVFAAGLLPEQRAQLAALLPEIVTPG